MPNIKFSYLYRDAGNYKKFNAVIFSNPKNVELKEIETFIRQKLIDNLWFYADQWHLPDLHFGNWDNQADHTFHEFEELTYINEVCNAECNVSEFLTRLIKL